MQRGTTPCLANPSAGLREMAADGGLARRGSQLPLHLDRDFARSRASGLDEDFERQWRVPKRAGVDYRAASGCALDRRLGRLENCGSAYGVLAYAPQASATAYQCPDRKIAARRSMLDFAVGESQGQNRCGRDTERLPGPNVALLGCRCMDTLNSIAVFRDPSERPERNSAKLEEGTHGGVNHKRDPAVQHEHAATASQQAAVRSRCR